MAIAVVGVDLAKSFHPTTRIAWAMTRGATYQPELAAKAA